MKLREKYILSSILIVVIVITASFFLIGQRTNEEFKKFTIEKSKEVKVAPRDNKNNPPPPGNPENVQFAPDSPEARFVAATKSTLMIAGILGVFLAVIVSVFFSRTLLKKISQLQMAMNEYMKNGLSKKVWHADKDEIDELSGVYNSLIEKIDKQESIRKEFFIDMSHELRTPLTAVKGYLEGLNDGVFASEKEKEIQRKALIETDRMVHLIREMSVLAKFEANEQNFSKENVQLLELTKEVIALLVNESKEKNVIVETIGAVEAKVNRDKFKQIITNLLDNAISHGVGESKIFIEMKKENEKAVWLIKNKAENISAQDFEYIFERFYRSDKGRFYDGKKPHLGIGLNIVKKLVELHGGKIIASLNDGWVKFEVVI